MTTVLVTGAGAVLGQGIIKSLRAAAESYHIIAADPHPLASGLYWADRALTIPMARSPEYSKEFEHILDTMRPDVVLVGTDVELPVFAANRTDWEERFSTKIIVSSPQVIAIADDKYATACMLKSHGIPHAESALPEDGEALDDLVARHGFPLIVKPRRGARAIGVVKVNSRSELDDRVGGRDGLVVQQWAGADDEEYTAGALFFDGAVQAQITLRRELRDGNTFRAFVGEYPECDDYVRAVATALQPFGPANFQFRRGQDGQCRLFEINARFSGTTPMRTLVGFNEVELCINHVLFGTPIIKPVLRDGVILRHLEEQFVRAESVLRASNA